MCKEATIKTRVTTVETKTDTEKPVDHHDVLETIPVDEESKMLCQVIVRATYELVNVQQKTRNEIQTFLNDDCQKLASPGLVQKVKNPIFETTENNHFNWI